MYLTAAVAALGLAVYLSSYGPLFEASADFFTPTLLDLGVVASLLAALIAGAGLVPKQKTAPALVAVLSVLGFLLVIAIVLTAPQRRQHRLGPLPDHRVQRGAGDRRRRGAAVRRGCHHAACAAAPLRAAAAVRPVRRSRTGITDSPSSPARRTSRARSTSSAPAIRRRTAVATRVVRRRADSRRARRAGPPTPPTGFPTYGQPPSSSNAPTTQVPAQPSPSSTRRSPARRRRSLSRACVNFARVS